MEVRLDARTTSASGTEDLGIRVGDFVAFDPRVEVTDGFIRSRHLDDKACVASIVAALKSLLEAGQVPEQTIYVLISNYRRGRSRRLGWHPARGLRTGGGGYGCHRGGPGLRRVSRHHLCSRTAADPITTA